MPVRFYLGETYEGDFPEGLRRAIVVSLADDKGLKGKLRFFDTNEDYTVHWTELHHAGNWQLVPTSQFESDRQEDISEPPIDRAKSLVASVAIGSSVQDEPKDWIGRELVPTPI